MENPKSSIQSLEKTIYNPQFKWLEKQEIKNSTVWKNQNPQIAMLGKAQILNFNICKSQHPQFQWLEKPKSWIPTFGKH